MVFALLCPKRLPWLIGLRRNSISSLPTTSLLHIVKCSYASYLVCMLSSAVRHNFDHACASVVVSSKGRSTVVVMGKLFFRKSLSTLTYFSY